jgi:carbamoyl-phosphate synthase large subunit
LAKFQAQPPRRGHVAVKEAVFPFARFPGVDLLLGPEMKSTGEVMGLAPDFATAFAKSQIAAGTELPTKGRVFLSVKDKDKPAACRIARVLHELGFELSASRGTAAALAADGLPVQIVNKVHEGRPHIVDLIKDKAVAIVVNTTEGAQAIADSYSLRRAALMGKLPYYTTMAGARALVEGLRKLAQGSLEVRPLQAYLAEVEAG